MSTPVMPASDSWAWPAPPDGLDPDRLVWAETVHGGGYTHLVIRRGTTVRLTDLEGEACAHLLAFNADQPSERLNVADTVRIQWRDTLTAGCLLVSDRGRALATITQDTSQRHDSLFGTGWPIEPGAGPAGHHLLALAATKHNLGRSELAPGIAFFQGVSVDNDGEPHFLGSAGAGASVVLRAEMALLLLVANSAHPLDPRPEHSCGRLEVLAWRDTPTAPDDPQWTATPARTRAYANTAAYLSAQPVR